MGRPELHKRVRIEKRAEARTSGTPCPLSETRPVAGGDIGA